jgi:hypothetical protein
MALSVYVSVYAQQCDYLYMYTLHLFVRRERQTFLCQGRHVKSGLLLPSNTCLI